MKEVHYVCTGSCGGSVTEEQYKAGKQTCAAEGCDKHGQPLQRQECDEKTGVCSMPASQDHGACNCGDDCTCNAS